MNDIRNVIDEFKGKSEEEIINILDKMALNSKLRLKT